MKIACFSFLRRGTRPDGRTTEQSSRKAFPSGIKILCDPVDSTSEPTNIVFIHGLENNRETTWTAEGATQPWPQTILPSIFPAARILTFGYDPCVDSSRNVFLPHMIADQALSLLNSLASVREDGKRIIFVCLGFGGLVCESALETSARDRKSPLHSIFRSTRGIFFINPPNSECESWSDDLFLSIGLVKQPYSRSKTIFGDNWNEFEAIQRRFDELVSDEGKGQPRIEVAKCYVKTAKQQNVSRKSGQTAIQSNNIPLETDCAHIDMNQFTHTDDAGFRVFCERLDKWMRQAPAVKEQNLSRPRVCQYGHDSEQYNSFGEGDQKISGGNYYEAKGDQNFGDIPPTISQSCPPPPAYRR